MSPILYYHPLASFCHKVLIALYENATPFEGIVVDLMDEAASAPLREAWPVGKIPLLRDPVYNRMVPETSIIIEYLEQYYPGATTLIPREPHKARDVRLWDRFFDLYVSVPMQKLVLDTLRPEGQHDAYGVTEARESLVRAYGVADEQLNGRVWATGSDFSMADCAAAPGLFFANIVQPFTDFPHLTAYFERLLEKPSFARVLVEARPYLQMFPLRDQIPARFLDPNP